MSSLRSPSLSRSESSSEPTCGASVLSVVAAYVSPPRDPQMPQAETARHGLASRRLGPAKRRRADEDVCMRGICSLLGSFRNGSTWWWQLSQRRSRVHGGQWTLKQNAGETLAGQSLQRLARRDHDEAPRWHGDAARRERHVSWQRSEETAILFRIDTIKCYVQCNAAKPQSCRGAAWQPAALARASRAATSRRHAACATLR
jgi:hypothetical protein